MKIDNLSSDQNTWFNKILLKRLNYLEAEKKTNKGNEFEAKPQNEW